MGFFNLILGNSNDNNLEKDINQIKKNLKVSFKNLKSDINKQSSWIGYLYKLQEKLVHTQTNLKDKHHSLESIHTKDTQNLMEWIKLLHETQKNQDQQIKKLEMSVKGAFNTYNKYMLDLYKVVQDVKDTSNEHAKLLSQGNFSSSMDSSKRLDVSSKSEAQVITIEKAVPQKETMREGPLLEMSKKVTRSEKMVLAILMNSDQKLSYKDISMLMGVSVSTIKSHMCNIRNKGFPLQEYNDGGNIKRYYLAENMKKILSSNNF